MNCPPPTVTPSAPHCHGGLELDDGFDDQQRRRSGKTLTISGGITSTGSGSNLALDANGSGAITISGGVNNSGTITNSGAGTGLTSLTGGWERT